MWLTKAVDTSVSLLVHVVVYTVPSLRRPPVLLVRHRVIRRGKLWTLTSRLNYRPQRLFHPLIALGVHIVSNEVVVGLVLDAFMILTIVPDRVVSAEVFKAGAAIGYTQEVSSSLLE